MTTFEKLSRAIVKRLDLPREEAEARAERVLDYFGFRTVIIDNAIQPEDRKLFYDLQDAGLLRSYWEAVLLLSGRTWRIFYWELVAADLDRVLGSEEPVEEGVYRTLPDEAWGHPPAST
ncbi:MAG: hypothetical protein A3K68_01845 [Euryarchaeota archaeon RBG_16_68_13]|nr:MAG: hypothetical protein A3K68_01845 [Euryarchaeota archaeon RBG_16_68_13]